MWTKSHIGTCIHTNIIRLHTNRVIQTNIIIHMKTMLNNNMMPVCVSPVLTSQQMSQLTSLAVGKASGTATIPAGQFIQLTGATQGAGVTVPTAQGTSQPLHPQLAFQKAGAGGTAGQTLQFHQLQLKQGAPPTLTPAAAAALASSKAKSKKRGGATPPKSLWLASLACRNREDTVSQKPWSSGV